MLISSEANITLQSLSDLIQNSTGLFQFIEEFGALMVLLETDEGFEWKDVTDCIKIGVVPKRNNIHIISRSASNKPEEDRV